MIVTASLPIWPDYALPHSPFDSDYTFTTGDTRVRTALEQGTPRQRRASDLSLDTFQLRWQFTAAQYELFRGFVDTALAGGSGWFVIPIFIDTDYVSLPSRFVKGSIDNRKRADAKWEVTATLEVANLPVMASADLDAAIGAAPGDGSLPAWPTAVLDPVPLNDNFAHIIADGINRADQTTGDIEQDRPFRQMPALYQWSIPLTNAQYQIYRGFLFWRCKGGDGWFTAPMMRGGSYETQAVRIVAGTRKDTRSGGDWIASAQLEVADLAPFSLETTFSTLLLQESGIDCATLEAALAGLCSDFSGAVT